MIRWTGRLPYFRACFDLPSDEFYFDVLCTSDGAWKLRWPASWEPGIELAATDAESAKAEALTIVRRVVRGAAKCFEETE